MTTAPKRRWLRFSLRAVMVAFTLVALWLGWNVYLVRQRREFSEYLHTIGQDISPLHPPYPNETEMKRLTSAIAQIADETFGPEPYTRYRALSPGSVSIVRRWLGDQPYLVVMYWDGPDTDGVRKLFAEAVVVVSDRPYKEAAAQHGWHVPVEHPGR